MKLLVIASGELSSVIITEDTLLIWSNHYILGRPVSEKFSTKKIYPLIQLSNQHEIARVMDRCTLAQDHLQLSCILTGEI